MQGELRDRNADLAVGPGPEPITDRNLIMRQTSILRREVVQPDVRSVPSVTYWPL
jgi:hypothetical protein